MDDFIAGGEGFRFPLYAYWLFLSAFLCLCAFLLYKQAKIKQYKRHTVTVYLLSSIPLAFFCGRLIYSAIRYDWIYLDSMGNFMGILPFFNPAIGGVNAIGVITGCLLAGFVTAGFTKQSAGRILDSAVPFGVLLFALARLIEPITGQGFGDLLEKPLLPFYPFGIMNDWGEWMLPVCAMEGMLALLVFAALILLRRKTVKPGMLALYGMALLSASQIIPQSLRQDDVLTIFIFAKVNQIGYMVLLCGSMICAGALALRHHTPKQAVLPEWTAMVIGVLLTIGCEYALDKTNLPDLLVYAIMITVIACMCALTVRRIHKEDAA